jgi:hypothetical protein
MKLIAFILSPLIIFIGSQLQPPDDYRTSNYAGVEAVTVAETPPPVAVQSHPRTFHENQSSICVNSHTREHYIGWNVTKAETLDVLSKAGFSGDQLEMMAAISRAESGSDLRCWGDENLQDSTWRESYGLFQIRMLKNPGNSCRNYDVLRDNIQAQANCAKEIYNSQGYGAWSVTHGSRGRPYLKWMGKNW